jgi:RNA polymerase primary sigma factor
MGLTEEQFPPVETQHTTCRIDELQKHYKRASQLAERLPTIPAKKKAREYRRCRCGLGREIVRISLIIRNLGLTNFERERLIDRVNKTVDIMRSLDRQVSDLETHQPIIGYTEFPARETTATMIEYYSDCLKAPVSA